MTQEHPNIALLKRLDLGNLAAAADLFAPDVVFHFFNPNLPEHEGDYVGVATVSALSSKPSARILVEPSR